jgi:hypothetical protein
LQEHTRPTPLRGQEGEELLETYSHAAFYRQLQQTPAS